MTAMQGRAHRGAIPATVAERLAKHANLRCTYRGCPNRPIRRMTPSNCPTAWWGCAEHWQAMADALNNGLPGATTGTGWVEVIDLDQTRDSTEGDA